MTDRVSVQIEDHVADVRLCRPDKMNALAAAIFQAPIETGRKLATELEVRAVVLSEEGRALCVGLDFTSFRGMTGDERKGPGFSTATARVRPTTRS